MGRAYAAMERGSNCRFQLSGSPVDKSGDKWKQLWITGNRFLHEAPDDRAVRQVGTHKPFRPPSQALPKGQHGNGVPRRVAIMAVGVALRKQGLMLASVCPRWQCRGLVCLNYRAVAQTWFYIGR